MSKQFNTERDAREMASATKPRRRRPHVFDANTRGKFLHCLSLGFSVVHAAEMSGISRKTAYKHREQDPQLAAAWDDAIERGTDALEDEAVRRAVHGVKIPVFHKGKIVGARLAYSDMLLITLLNARRPEKFKYRAEVMQKPAEPIDLSKLSGKQLDALKDILRTLRGEKPNNHGDEGQPENEREPTAN